MFTSKGLWQYRSQFYIMGPDLHFNGLYQGCSRPPAILLWPKNLIKYAKWYTS